MGSCGSKALHDSLHKARGSSSTQQSYAITPADNKLRIVEMLLQGKHAPTHAELLGMKEMLLKQADLRKPVLNQPVVQTEEALVDEVIPGGVGWCKGRVSCPLHTVRCIPRCIGSRFLALVDSPEDLHSCHA
jgi:hypothetical protein